MGEGRSEGDAKPPRRRERRLFCPLRLAGPGHPPRSRPFWRPTLVSHAEDTAVPAGSLFPQGPALFWHSALRSPASPWRRRVRLLMGPVLGDSRPLIVYFIRRVVVPGGRLGPDGCCHRPECRVETICSSAPAAPATAGQSGLAGQPLPLHWSHRVLTEQTARPGAGPRAGGLSWRRRSRSAKGECRPHEETRITETAHRIGG